MALVVPVPSRLGDSLASAAPAPRRFVVRHIGIAVALFEPEPMMLSEQLASIVGQSWTAWTCVITADSPVATLRTDARLASFFRDPRFCWVENPVRLGHLRNFEQAIQACAAQPVEAIACCDQDDIWEVDKLAVLVAALEQAGPLALVHSDLSVLAPDGTISPGPTVWEAERRGITQVLPEHLLVRNVVSGCAMLFDAELARRVPSIPLAVDYHDRWYALVAACLGGVHAVARPLVRYRQHPSQVVGLRVGLTATEMLRMLWWWARGPYLTASAYRAADVWRSYLAVSDALTRVGLLRPRRRRGWHLLLLGLRWIRRDATLGGKACVLATGSLLARLLPIVSAPRDANGAVQ
jgi:hypothetical protein